MPPTYMKNSVKIGSKVFYIDGENAETDKQSLALYVLNHWQEMPVVGYHLVPEHVETRTLYNPDRPNLHHVTLWKLKFMTSFTKMIENLIFFHHFFRVR